MIKEKYNALKEKLSFLKWIDPFTYVEIALRKYHPKKLKPSFSDEAIDYLVYVVFALIFAFLLYSVLGFLLNTSSPMVIVSSSSMVPEMHRGDIIVLFGEKNIQSKEISVDFPLKNKMYSDYGKTFPKAVEKYINPLTGKLVIKINKAKEIQIGEKKIPITKEGDTIVYYSDYSKKEIIHRTIAKINALDGVFFLTKGDANPSIDQECTPIKNNFNQTAYLACITKNAVPEEEITGKAVLRIPLLGCVKLWVFDNIPSLFSGKLPKEYSGFC